MDVRIPTPLRSYTDQQRVVRADGGTIGALLEDLDRQFPGIRFRIVDEQHQLRQHMNIYVNDRPERDLAAAITEADEVTIMQALSGG